MWYLRYYDDYYYYNRGAAYGREDPYANNRDPYNVRGDRNWYYQQEKYGQGYGNERNPYAGYVINFYEVSLNETIIII